MVASGAALAAAVTCVAVAVPVWCTLGCCALLYSPLPITAHASAFMAFRGSRMLWTSGREVAFSFPKDKQQQEMITRRSEEAAARMMRGVLKQHLCISFRRAKLLL